MIIKFNEFLNESFDDKHDTIIVIQTPWEYHKIINDFINWGYEYYMEGEWDEEELEDLSYYPFSLTTDEFKGFYIDMIENDDFEDYELEDNHNVYRSVDDFYSDTKCVNFLKKKGVIKPDYSPRKTLESLNEAFDSKKEILILIESKNDYRRIKNSLNKWEYSNITGKYYDPRIFDQDQYYPIIVIIDVENQEYQANYLTNKQIDDLSKIIDIEYNNYSDIRKFYGDRNCINYVKYKGIPNYRPKKKHQNKVTESLNESFSTEKNTAVFINTPDEFVRFKNILNKWGYEWGNSKYYTEDEFEDDYNFPSVVTFFTDSIGKYEVHIIDPWNYEEDESKYWNEYKTIDDFLNDKEALEFIKYKGVRVPNYKPKKRG